MRTKFGVLIIWCLVAFGLTCVASSPAFAATANSVVWGKSYSHKSYVFHQVAGKPGPLALHSADGNNDFVVNANGDLSTSRIHAEYGYARLLWYPYWRAHSNGKGAYFFMQTDGHLIVKRADKKTIVWKTGKYLKAGTQNFALVLSNDGSLTEYYASGNPLKASGRHILWKMARYVGGIHNCGGGGLTGNTTEYRVLLQNTHYSVSVHNFGYLGMAVSVYRWYDGSQMNRKAAELGPGATHDFGVQWDTHLSDFTTVVVRVDTTATNNPAAATTIRGNCWYRA